MIEGLPDDQFERVAAAITELVAAVQACHFDDVLWLDWDVSSKGFWIDAGTR